MMEGFSTFLGLQPEKELHDKNLKLVMCELEKMILGLSSFYWAAKGLTRENKLSLMQQFVSAWDNKI